MYLCFELFLSPHPNQPQILQNPAKRSQIRAKKIKEKRLGLPWILLAEMSLFNGLS
jgi:hypothetical protein